MVAFLLGLGVLAFPQARAGDLWPDLSAQPHTSGGGERDAAVIVGVENYAFVAKVPGARANAEDWQAHLTAALKVPSHRVALLRDNEATDSKMRKFAARAAAEVQPGGTLWFVFIGHGAPSKDGKDGVLVGADAQQDAEGLYARSLCRGEILDLLAKGRQARTVVLLDACFSGRTSSGEALAEGLQPLVVAKGPAGNLDGRTILLTAARSDQFAGPLPRAGRMRPAFSYLALGALRGWAADAEGRVTASALVDFTVRALALDKGRIQTPELTAGSPAAVLGLGRERAPDLARIDREGGGGEADGEEALGAKPRSAADYLRRGKALLRMQRVADAMDDFSQALRLKPKYPEALLARGIALLAQGRVEDAVKDFDSVLRLDSRSAPAYAGRAAGHAYRGDDASAAADYSKALEVAPPEWPQRAKVEGALSRLRARAAGADSGPAASAGSSAWIGIRALPSREGVLVGSVIAGSPAAKAGLRPDDVIIRVSGSPTRGPKELAAAVAQLGPGELALLEVIRERQPLSIKVLVGKTPGAP